MLRHRFFRPALRAFQAYEVVLARRPVTTQLVVGTALVTVGDALAQHAVERAPLREHDWRRTGNMAFLRGVLHSSMIIYWYRFLHRSLPLPRASLYGRLAIHLTLDQAFFGPGNVAFFFVASGVLERKSRAEIQEKLDDRLWQTITSAWMLWFITFRFIPMNYRLVSGQFVAIFWNCFMSYQNANARTSLPLQYSRTIEEKLPRNSVANCTKSGS